MVFATLLALDSLRSLLEPRCPGAGRLALLARDLAFVLSYAFYCGALTMFLASEKDPPFWDLHDGLASGRWEVALSDGEEFLFTNIFDVFLDPVFACAHADAQSATAFGALAGLEEVVAGLGNRQFLFADVGWVAHAVATLPKRELIQFCPQLIQKPGD